MRAKMGCLAGALMLTTGVALAQYPPSSPSALLQVPVPIVPVQGTSPVPQTGPVPPPAPSSQPGKSPELLPLPAPAPGQGSGGVGPYSPVPPAPPGDYLVPAETPLHVWHADNDFGSRFWIEGDFLLWFIKNGPLNVPLVTTGSSTDANPAALGQPHTQVLYGDSSLNYGAIPGGRLEMGYWFDQQARFGIQAGFFLLSQENTTYSAFSNSAGSPILSVPFFNAQTLQEDQVPVASPGFYAGGVVVRSSSVSGGANLDGCFNVVRTSGFQVDLLGGFRFVDLRELLDIQTPDISIGSNATSGSTAYNTVDDFRTSNQFYGGQLGGRVGYHWDRLSVDLNAAVSLGSTYQSINIDGFSTAVGPSGGPPAVSPGGIFAQPTNMGHYRGWDFTVVPEAGLKIGFQVWRNLQISAGYDFLYWSSVVRPGAQIDREVNLSQSSLLGGGTLAGPAQPVAPLSRSDFYVHGLTLGMQFAW